MDSVSLRVRMSFVIFYIRRRFPASAVSPSPEAIKEGRTLGEKQQRPSPPPPICFPLAPPVRMAGGNGGRTGTMLSPSNTFFLHRHRSARQNPLASAAPRTCPGISWHRLRRKQRSGSGGGQRALADAARPDDPVCQGSGGIGGGCRMAEKPKGSLTIPRDNGMGAYRHCGISGNVLTPEPTRCHGRRHERQAMHGGQNPIARKRMGFCRSTRGGGCSDEGLRRFPSRRRAIHRKKIQGNP